METHEIEINQIGDDDTNFPLVLGLAGLMRSPEMFLVL